MSDININQNEQAREAERAVLGGLMLETQRFDTVIQVIKENDFDGKDHQIIFQINVWPIRRTEEHKHLE